MIVVLWLPCSLLAVVRVLLRLPVDHPALHHECYLREHADIRGRIATHRDEVGGKAGPDLADAILQPQDPSIDGGGGQQRARWRHAIAAHLLQLAVVVAVPEPTHIAADAEAATTPHCTPDSPPPRCLPRGRGL